MSKQSFIASYIETALWSSTYGDDNDTRNLDDGEHDLAPETRKEMETEAGAFYDAHSDQFQYDNITRNSEDVDAGAGHDFWLTRCGHGAGFWDGDWVEPVATQLTNAAHEAGERDLYVGDDGVIYQS
jgi:hypothetical protein